MLFSPRCWRSRRPADTQGQNRTSGGATCAAASMASTHLFLYGSLLTAPAIRSWTASHAPVAVPWESRTFAPSCTTWGTTREPFFHEMAPIGSSESCVSCGDRRGVCDGLMATSASTRGVLARASLFE